MPMPLTVCRRAAGVAAAFALAGAGGLAASSSASAAPRPGHFVEKPVHSTAWDSRTVKETYVRQYEPLPAADGSHPTGCDWIGYQRYRYYKGPRNPARADAVLVAQPGNLAGADHLDIVARNVIEEAAKRGRYLEFWAIDRRANCLEDRTGIEAAARAHDPSLAVDYYFHGRAINGHRFAGFLGPSQLHWLANMGLAQTVQDEYDLIARRIPYPLRRKKVFCGGHSHGGFMTAAFAMWDFNRTPGYDQCAGYFALETLIDLDPGQASRTGLIGTSLGSATYAATVAAIKAGALPSTETASPLILNPETMVEIEMAAIAAYQDPGQQTRLLQLLPRDANTEFVLRGLFSLLSANVLTDPRALRLTNMAFFGGLVDDNSDPFGFIAPGIGIYGGGPLAPKDLSVLGPIGPTLLGTLPLVPTLLTSDRQVVPAKPNGPLYYWCNYNQLGSTPGCPRDPRNTSGNPITSPQLEVTDARQWARAWFGEGPTDLVEWYFPTRLLTDTVAAIAGARSGDLAALKYPDGPRKRPTITILGGESLGPAFAKNPGVYAQPPNKFVDLSGYNHADVTGAAQQQNNGKPEAASNSLTNFVLSIIGPLPTIRLSVHPRRVRAGQTVRVRFRVHSSSSACRAGVTITVAGHRVRTDRHGQATVRIRAARARRLMAWATKSGCQSSATVVRVKDR